MAGTMVLIFSWTCRGPLHRACSQLYNKLSWPEDHRYIFYGVWAEPDQSKIELYAASHVQAGSNVSCRSVGAPVDTGRAEGTGEHKLSS